MPDELLERLRRFQTDAFALQRSHFHMLVGDGQHPTTLFIGCSDSRLVSAALRCFAAPSSAPSCYSSNA